MNTMLSFITGLFIFLSIPTDIPYGTIERAMEMNDAKTIVHLGKDKISLNISGKEAVYPISQAELVLHGFFTKYPKGTFAFKFKGKDSGEDIIASEHMSPKEKISVAPSISAVGNWRVCP